MLGVGERPRGLGVVIERKVAVGLERQLVDAKAVLPQQMLGLVEARLARGGRGREPLERCADDRLERAEVRVMKEPLALEPRDEPEHLAVALTDGTNDELGGRAAA